MPFNRAFTTTEVYGFVLGSGLFSLFIAYRVLAKREAQMPPFPAETATTITPELVGWGKTWPRPIAHSSKEHGVTSPPLA